jgi:hypothetical protein
MPQTRVNGAVAGGQFLTGALTHLIVDVVDGGATANIANFGFTAGAADPGEKMVQAIQTVAAPVILQSGNARVMYVAVEFPGVDAADVQTAVRAAGFANATVTAGTYRAV